MVKQNNRCAQVTQNGVSHLRGSVQLVFVPGGFITFDNAKNKPSGVSY